MQKWKLIFDVTWEDGLPAKRQIFEPPGGIAISTDTRCMQHSKTY